MPEQHLELLAALAADGELGGVFAAGRELAASEGLVFYPRIQ